MSRLEDQVRLRHMLEAARLAVTFIKNRQPSDLAADPQLALALVKAIEIVGEAAVQVSEQTIRSYPQLPWDKMRGMRNRLIHAYFDINHDILWATAQKSLPVLIQQLEQILDG